MSKMSRDELEKTTLKILKAEIRLVFKENVDGDVFWRVKKGNLEHCSRLIAEAISSIETK